MHNNSKIARIYNIEGVGELPSVTTIIGQLDKSGPLMGWAVKTVIDYLKSHQDDLAKDPYETFKKAKQWHKELQIKALDFGSALHNLIEVYLKNQPLNGLLEAMPELVKPFEEFKAWQKKHNFKLIDSEQIVWSDFYRYAGTLDIVAELNGKKYVVDFKSSKAIYDEYLMQIAAYWKAYEESKKLEDYIQGLMVLRLPKVPNDTQEEKEWTLEQGQDAFDEFMCLCTFWHEKQRHKKK